MNKKNNPANREAQPRTTGERLAGQSSAVDSFAREQHHGARVGDSAVTQTAHWKTNELQVLSLWA